jgi:exopolysaccharide/PEP-CTERM locus tyrosine autokinase
MSLVERALKKIQESRAQMPSAGVANAAGPHTIPLDVAAPRAAGVAPPVVTQAVHVARVAPPPVRPSQVVRIDRDALRHSELLPPPSQERQLAGEYRQIKRALIANALGRGVPKLPQGHRIMVASAMPGDGKTFTSINLALSIANEKDLSVVLIDADVAKAHLSRTFGVQNNSGLMDLLRDETADPEALILPTDVPGLSLLPAGKGTDVATELLSSARMETIARQISARDPNRILLFDSSPLLVTSEAIALVNAVGQVVLVVRAGVTPQSAVLDAIDLLGEGKSVGLVLNQTDEQGRPGYYYRYGYPEQGRADGEGDLTDDIKPVSPRGDAG